MMPEGELWENDLLQNMNHTRLYSEQYLGETLEEEEEEGTVSPEVTSYSELFLRESEEDWESPPSETPSETIPAYDQSEEEVYGGQEESKSAKVRTEEAIEPPLRKGKDPSIMRKILQIRDAFRPKDLPRLSARSEKILNSNYRQLAIAEGGLLSQQKEIKSLYITSSFRGEGKTISAVSLAYALSVIGKKDVLLVDGNLQSPQIHRLFNINNTLGFRDVLGHRLDSLDAVIPTAYAHLYIVASGGNRPSVQRPLEGQEIDEILLQYSSGFDYIVFDGSPTFSSPEPTLFARYFDGVILILECERTKWEVAQESVEKITNAGGSVIGIILNKRKFYIPQVIYNKI